MFTESIEFIGLEDLKESLQALPPTYTLLICDTNTKNYCLPLLDLDNYNNDTEDGLHITSMAGSWLSVIKGFAGMKIQNNLLSFHPFLPEKWKSYSFKIKHQSQSIKITVNGEEIVLENESENDKIVKIYNKRKTIAALGRITVNHN